MAKAFFLYSNFYGGYIVMDSLNNEQKKAVTHFKGPCMVIGTPGSGKTRVITERVHYLVQECKINPSNILVITFTKAAAVEMKRRYYDLAGNNAGKVQFGTFHAGACGYVQRASLAGVVATCHFCYGICLGMKHIRQRNTIFRLTYIGESGRRAVKAVRYYHLVLDNQRSYLSPLAI